MRLHFSLLAALASFPSFAEADLHYQVTRLGTGTVQIDLELGGEPDGTTRLALPHEWAGQLGYEKALSDFEALSPDTTIRFAAEDMLELVHPPTAPLHLRYHVNAWTPEGPDPSEFYWPILKKDHFHFMGKAVFVEPLNDSARGPITLEWVGFPTDWSIGNSHGVNERWQLVQGGVGKLLYAIYTGGDFRIHRFDVRGNPVYVAIRGLWRFTDRALLEIAQRVFEAERSFFSDFDYPHYFVSLVQTSGPCCQMGGTGLSQSFAMEASSFVQAEWFIHLLAHELFHNWNGRKIRRQSPEELVYWFSEGFTEYYTHLLTLRSGLLTLEQYFEEINRTLVNYHRSPVRNAPNERILSEFWTNSSIQKLPYLRGELIALRWNTLAKQSGRGSLDGFMHDLFKEATQQGTVVSLETVERLMAPYVPEGVAGDLASAVGDGATVELPQGALGPCAISEIKPMASFDLGFDEPLSFEKGEISGLRRESAAYLAGLREGQRLLNLKVRYGDPDRPAIVTVVDFDGSQRKIEYYPAGVEIAVPQYSLDKDLMSRSPAVCQGWFDN